jgi:hypothetical protein
MSASCAAGWLCRQQKDGVFGGVAVADFVYSYVLATNALCEAYGLSGDAALLPYAQAGLDYLEKHRNPYSAWRYQPRDNDNDTSVTAWAMSAYVTGPCRARSRRPSSSRPCCAATTGAARPT